MQSLKIEKNPFIYATVDEYISHIKPTKYKLFMSELFGTQHQYLNGLDRVAKVAEQFKPVEMDHSRSKAEQLIKGVETMNTVLWNEAKELKRVFEDYVEMYEFKNVCDETKSILNNVAPYHDIGQLTINIRKYQTSADAITAFKNAIASISNRNTAIESPKVRKMIGGASC